MDDSNERVIDRLICYGVFKATAPYANCFVCGCGSPISAASSTFARLLMVTVVALGCTPPSEVGGTSSVAGTGRVPRDPVPVSFGADGRDIASAVTVGARSSDLSSTIAVAGGAGAGIGEAPNVTAVKVGGGAAAMVGSCTIETNEAGGRGWSSFTTHIGRYDSIARSRSAVLRIATLFISTKP